MSDWLADAWGENPLLASDRAQKHGRSSIQNPPLLPNGGGTLRWKTLRSLP